MRSKVRDVLAWTACVIACFVAIGAYAQPQLDEDDVNAIIRSLAPTLTPPSQGDLLSLGGSATNEALTTPLQGAYPVASAATIVIQRPLEVIVSDQVIVLDADRSIDLEVFFPFDSSELTPQAIRSLQGLGTALASPELRPFSYLVAGHTDARGAALYNRDLSMRRAEAVREFLLRQFAIDPSRLLSVGFGEDRLRSTTEPNAAINRRVEIVLIAQRLN